MAKEKYEKEYKLFVKKVNKKFKRESSINSDTISKSCKNYNY
jgi:hypothetical protein